MKYNKDSINKLFEKNKKQAQDLLSTLQVAERRSPNINQLNGWVYEQTIRYCLRKELTELGMRPIIEEQRHLKGRIKVDLLIRDIAIEVKASGFINAESDKTKYYSYRKLVEEKGWKYFYLTRCEDSPKCREAAESAFGRKRTFFLDTSGDWERFVKELVDNNRVKGTAPVQ